MSGGRYQYAYEKIERFADAIEMVGETAEDNKLRIALKAHLLLVAAAMKAVEWEDSGDTGPGDTNTAICNVLLAPRYKL